MFRGKAVRLVFVGATSLAHVSLAFGDTGKAELGEISGAAHEVGYPSLLNATIELPPPALSLLFADFKVGSHLLAESPAAIAASFGIHRAEPHTTLVRSELKEKLSVGKLLNQFRFSDGRPLRSSEFIRQPPPNTRMHTLGDALNADAIAYVVKVPKYGDAVVLAAPQRDAKAAGFSKGSPGFRFGEPKLQVLGVVSLTRRP